MNCRDFLAEFEERRDALSQPARLHRDDCPDCKKTSGEQTRVWQMIDGLKRIDAPNNFDFRVKAKIANSKPADFQPRLLPVLRYVLPFSLVVLIMGLVVYNTAYFSTDNAAPQIVATASQAEIAAENLPNSSSSPEQFAVTNNSSQSFTNEETVTDVSKQTVKPAKEGQETQFIAIKSKRNPTIESRRRNANNSSAGAGSNERALTSTKVLMPENLDPNKIVESSPSVGSQNLIEEDKIWELIGIEIVSNKQSLEVKAVKQNSLAARSGIKVGDVIEAVDGVKLSAEPLRAKRIDMKKLTVVRGAEKIEVTLKN